MQFRMAALLCGAGLLAGCPGRADIMVQCRVESDGVQCTAEHVKGASAGKACWELVFSCENGTQARARACQVVEPKSSAIVRIEKKDIKDYDKCDRVANIGVENLAVSPPD